MDELTIGYCDYFALVPTKSKYLINTVSIFAITLRNLEKETTQPLIY